MISTEELTNSGYIAVKGGTFKIDGITVASPDGIDWEEHTLSRAWNSSSGEQHKINMRIRRKVVWKYSVIGKESLDEIYNILNTKRTKYCSTRFDISTLYFTGIENMTVEWGTPFKVNCIDGVKDLYSCDISFVEPVGIKLSGAEV